MVVPVDPCGGGLLDGAPGEPGQAVVVDQFCLVQPDGGFHQGVVEGVCDGSDGAGDPCLVECFGEGEGGVLGAGIGVVNQPGGGEGHAGARSGHQSLFQGGKDQAGGDPPAEDTAGVHIGDEGHVTEPAKDQHIGEVRNPATGSQR